MVKKRMLDITSINQDDPINNRREVHQHSATRPRDENYGFHQRSRMLKVGVFNLFYPFLFFLHFWLLLRLQAFVVFVLRKPC